MKIRNIDELQHLAIYIEKINANFVSHDVCADVHDVIGAALNRSARERRELLL